MLIASFIAQPGALDPAFVTAMQTAMGGGTAVWLAPDRAAEVAVPQRPANADDLWKAAQEQGVDLNFLPAEGRRKRLLLADMDSTLIEQECIDELADEAGVGPRVADITARAMNGELDFDGALRERVGLLAGLSTNVIADVLARRITLAPGGPQLIATMQSWGAHCALVSGGFTAFSGPVADRLGMDSHRANVLECQGDKLTGQVVPPILGRDAKIARLDALCHDLTITTSDAVAVGDGANDLGMLGAAGMGVALHAKPAVAAQSPIRINHGDLTALLFLQGVPETEFSYAP